MRSILFVPADSPRKFAKAMGTAVDAVVLDLEDSIALSAKTEARRTAAEMLTADRCGKIMIVRVNAFDTGLILDDLATVMPHSPDIVMLPKCRGAADINLLTSYLEAFEAASGKTRGITGVLPVATETGEAVIGLASYRPHPRLRGLMWGAEDLTASINATGNRDGEAYSGPFQLARNLCLMAASAAEVPAIDTVCTSIRDLDYVFSEARAARRDGFSGKAIIHPSHVDVVNAAFRPSEAEANWAREVIAMFERNAGVGVVTIDGKMIDKPHERAALRILASEKLANA